MTESPQCGKCGGRLVPAASYSTPQLLLMECKECKTVWQQNQNGEWQDEVEPPTIM